LEIDRVTAGPLSDHHWQPKYKTIDEWEVVLQTLWEELLQEHISIQQGSGELTTCLSACVAAHGGHSEHLQ